MTTNIQAALHDSLDGCMEQFHDAFYMKTEVNLPTTKTKRSTAKFPSKNISHSVIPLSKSIFLKMNFGRTLDDFFRKIFLIELSKSQ